MGLLKKVGKGLGKALSAIDPTKKGTITSKGLAAVDPTNKNSLIGKGLNSGIGKIAVGAAGLTVGIPPSVSSAAVNGLQSIGASKVSNSPTVSKSAVTVQVDPKAGLQTTSLMSKPQAVTTSSKIGFDWKGIGKRTLGKIFGEVDDELTRTNGDYKDVKTQVTKEEIWDIIRKYWYVPVGAIAVIIYMFIRKKK